MTHSRGIDRDPSSPAGRAAGPALRAVLPLAALGLLAPPPAAAQCSETECPTPHVCPEGRCPEHPTPSAEPSAPPPRGAGCPLSWADRVARPRPISTDRPGNGNAASTVPRLRVQVETSVGWGLDAGAIDGTIDGHLVSFPTALRVGVTDWLELRAITGIVGIEVLGDVETHVHATDTSVGLKAYLLPAVGALPDLALVVDVFLPSGDGPFTAGVVAPDARLAAAWGLPAGFGLLLNAGVDLIDAGDRVEGRFLYVVNVNWTFPPALTDRLAIFVEAYGRESFRDATRSIRQLDAGLTFRVHDDLQLDLFSQHAFTDASPDHQVALGVSARF